MSRRRSSAEPSRNEPGTTGAARVGPGRAVGGRLMTSIPLSGGSLGQAPRPHYVWRSRDPAPLIGPLAWILATSEQPTRHVAPPPRSVLSAESSAWQLIQARNRDVRAVRGIAHLASGPCSDKRPIAAAPRVSRSDGVLPGAEVSSESALPSRPTRVLLVDHEQPPAAAH